MSYAYVCVNSISKVIDFGWDCQRINQTKSIDLVWFILKIEISKPDQSDLWNNKEGL